MTEIAPGSESIINLGDLTIYSAQDASISLGTHTLYKDIYTGELFIKLSTGIDFDVLDQSSNVITVANKTLIDYKTGSAPIIKLKVATDGTNYYIANGLYESVKLNLSFTKPSTAVGAIDCKVTVGSYKLSPNILFAGAAIIDGIPTQYNGITRSSITALDTTSGSLFKASGSPIAFGADTDVSLSFYLDKDSVKGIEITAA